MKNIKTDIVNALKSFEDYSVLVGSVKSFIIDRICNEIYIVDEHCSDDKAVNRIMSYGFDFVSDVLRHNRDSKFGCVEPYVTFWESPRLFIVELLSYVTESILFMHCDDFNDWMMLSNDILTEQDVNHLKVVIHNLVDDINNGNTLGDDVLLFAW